MEIKVGDKVRVPKYAPRILRKTIPSKVFEEESEVIAKDDELAVIWTEPIHKNLVPLKYLIKVEDEAKEPKPKYKEGDWVKMPDGDVAVIVKVNIDSSHPYDLKSIKTQGTSYSRWSESDLEPYTEPTEEKKDNTITIPVKVDLDETFWDAYTADLAKEIAIVYAKQKRDVRMAVRAAKSVVEELKKK